MRLAKAVGLLAILFALGGLAYYLRPFSTGGKQAAVPAPSSRPSAVGALGRIEPGDGVIRLAARSLSGQPSIVGKLLVGERDQVKAGQVIAELDSAPQLRATAELAEARVDVARKRLAQVQAGAKPSDLSAQRTEIERLDAEIAQAQTDLRRHQRLRDSNSIADAALEEVRLRAETLTRQRKQASERLTSLSEVRPVDVDVARAEVEAGIREVARARAEYDATRIRAPFDGRVIKVRAWPGEEVGPAGLLELAKTNVMYVLADIAEGDMSRVRTGQRAKITGNGLPRPLSGVVESVGLRVTENSVLKVDPAEFSDARVVEARIRLDDGAQVAQLIHLRVNVLIELSPAAPEQRDAR